MSFLTQADLDRIAGLVIAEIGAAYAPELWQPVAWRLADVEFPVNVPAGNADGELALRSIRRNAYDQAHIDEDPFAIFPEFRDYLWEQLNEPSFPPDLESAPLFRIWRAATT